jgi:biopolymer transport protein ExbD
MARTHHYRRRTKDSVKDADMTTFLNLMVVLVPFLLLTAVFSRITIVELHLPSSSAAAAATSPNLRVEVVVRDAGLEITNGTDVIAAIPKVEQAYDLPKLSELLLELKRDHPQLIEASVLVEPRIAYEHLIHVMDAVKSVETDLDGQLARVALFPAISVGDAP